MCGFVATLRFGSTPAPVTAALLTKMRDTMIHRGPDSEGLWINPERRVGMAHRRLSIIDRASAATQPMTTDDRRYALVFNGEIYNHREIRDHLCQAGVHDWRTSHSDTEVLLYAIRQWGALGCLPRLRGMFAFAVWDEQEQALVCVRDRIGIKPLYYALLGDRLNLASEIKALLPDSGQPREINETGLFDYLTFMTVPAPHTMFRGIKKLPGGCWLHVSRSGRTETGRYWDVWDEAAAGAAVPEARLAGEILERLDESVRLRTVSDVPVGVFLSGGIDSSTNLALFARAQTTAVKAFSIGYADPASDYQNEVDTAAVVAHRFGAEHSVLMLSGKDVTSFLPHMIQLQDEPIGDPVCVPLYYVSKLARDHGVIVAQVGEGADELFFGYPRWHQVLALESMLKRMPKLAPALILQGLRLMGKGDGYVANLTRRFGGGRPMFWSGAECFGDTAKRRLLSAHINAQFSKRDSFAAIDDIWTRFLDGAPRADIVNWMTYIDLNVRLPELLLMRVDKMSMGASVECRVPFLDHRFVGFVLGIDSAIRVRRGHPKSLLKSAVRGLIPDAIIDRRKQGFGLPMQSFVFGPLAAVIRAELDDFMRATDLLEPSGVEALWRRQDANSLWWLYSLAAWHRHWLGPQSPSQHEYDLGR